MDEEILRHIRALCRLMWEVGLRELDVSWRDTRVILRTEQAVRRERAAAAPPARPAPEAEQGLIEIRSPLLATFYRSPAPDRPPFVEVGDLVEKGQTVAVVEAMKVISDITAETAGRVVEICAENGKLVQENEVLMRLAAA